MTEQFFPIDYIKECITKYNGKHEKKANAVVINDVDAAMYFFSGFLPKTVEDCKVYSSNTIPEGAVDIGIVE